MSNKPQNLQLSLVVVVVSMTWGISASSWAIVQDQPTVEQKQQEENANEAEKPAPSDKNENTSDTIEKSSNDKDKNHQEDEKPEKKLTAAELEFQRRMDSLKKAAESEKEERPERPTFNLPKSTRSNKGAGGNITFDDIKFEMEKGERFDREMLTDEINNLVGKKISIKGYIRPNNKDRGLKKFVFVRDDKECCFGPGAALYDCVLVTMAKGKECDFATRPITVEGEFLLKEFKGPDRRVWAVYRMNNCRVVR